MTPDPEQPPAIAGSSIAATRWLPLAVLATVMVLGYALGWHKYLSFKTIGVNYSELQSFIANNFALALSAFVAIYIAAVALSAPGALILTLSGGLLFGWQIGAPATVVAATSGATLLYFIARSSFGDALAAKAGPALAKFRDGFNEDAFNYLLFLRLVPLFPFFLVNIAPALLGVPLRTYVAATFLGIIPATTAFSFAGAGLGSVVEAQNKIYQACLAASPANPDIACPYQVNTSALLTRELLAALVLLGVVSLIPIALKHFRGRHAKG